MDSTKQEASTGKNTNPKEAAPKKFLLTFQTEGYRKKRIYVNCAEGEVQGQKEQWVLILEEQTGRGPWICTEAEDVTGEQINTVGRSVYG